MNGLPPAPSGDAFPMVERCMAAQWWGLNALERELIETAWRRGEQVPIFRPDLGQCQLALWWLEHHLADGSIVDRSVPLMGVKLG